MNKLNEIRSHFSKILTIKNPHERTYLLSNLMTDMEKTFRIPMLQSHTYDKANPDIIQLYQKVSEARVLN